MAPIRLKTSSLEELAMSGTFDLSKQSLTWTTELKTSELAATTNVG